jgi:HK97 family phage major capsid protein
MGQDTDIIGVLRAFLDERSQARKFHADTIGADPSHCLGDFLVRVATKDRRGLETVYKTALSESTGGTVGGYLVPQEVRLDLFRTVAERAIIRPRALVVPMTSATLDLPLPDATTAQSAGTPPYFGGILMAWVNEGVSVPEQMEFAIRRVQLKANYLAGYAKVSNVLLEDAPGLEALLRRLFADAVAWFEDYYFFVGTGVGQPTGMQQSPAALPVSRNTSSKFLEVDAAKMVGQLLPSSWPRACWAMHPSVAEYLKQLGTTSWQANQPVMDRQGTPAGVLHGLPVFVTDKLPALGTTGDVVLFDPGLYVIGDRQEVEVAASEHINFLTNQTTFRVSERVDGQTWFNAPVTMSVASKTASPYVYLN